MTQQARISGAIIAPGKVEVDRNRQVVQHPGGGVVARILVDDGNYVQKGTLLVSLDTSKDAAELSFAREQMFDFEARKARLEAEILEQAEIVFPASLRTRAEANAAHAEILQSVGRMFLTSRQTLENQIATLHQQQTQITAQIEGFNAQIKALEAQLQLSARTSEDQENLLSLGLSPATLVRQVQQQKAELQGRLGGLRADLAEAGERFVGLDVEINRLIRDHRGVSVAALRDLEQSTRELRHRIRQLEHAIASAAIRAPTSGIVYQLAIHTPRSVVRPAEPLMYLIPQDRPRVIAANVQPQHIDQLRIGQEVKMRLAALNARTTPEVFGQITEVSADAIEDELRGGFYYRVEVQLSAGELEKLPKGAVLLPGMPVETFIQTGSRSPMAYLTKPITDYFARAFRDG